MKLYAHQFGKHCLRCQFEDPKTARALWEEFIPMVARHVLKLEKFAPDTELPPLHGQGFVFRSKLLTAFGEKFDVIIVDSEGIKQIASRIKPSGPESGTAN